MGSATPSRARPSRITSRKPTSTVGVSVAPATSSATQGVAIAAGIQDKFSFKAVGLAALTAGVGAGISKVPGFEKLVSGAGSLFGNAGARALAEAGVRQGLTNAATQGIAVAVGLQSKFSFAAVAASAVGGVVKARFGDFGVGKALVAEVSARIADGASQLVSGGALGIANAATRSLIEGTSFGDNIRAVLPEVIANTIGGAIAEEISGFGQYLADRIGRGDDGESITVGNYQQYAASNTRFDVEFGDLSPREALLGRVDNLLSQLTELDDLGVNDETDDVALETITEAAALYQEVRKFAIENDGFRIYTDSTAGTIGGAVVGVVKGAADSIIGILDAVTHPIESGQALLAFGARSVEYGVNVIAGDANPVADVRNLGIRARLFNAAIELEQSRIFLAEGNLQAAYFGAYEAGKIAGSAAGPAKLGEVLFGSRALIFRRPIGVSSAQFAEVANILRARATELGLGDDIIIQGSRVNGKATATSDIDIAIRLSPDDFTRFLDTQSKLASPNYGSAAFRSREAAIAGGRIFAREAKLAPTRDSIRAVLGRKVDLSIIRAGGPFDTGPQLALPKPPKPTGG